MERDAGWVEILDPRGRIPVARGHLEIELVPGPTDGEWRGEIGSLRRSPGIGPLPGGEYPLRFERSGDIRLVTLDHHLPLDGAERASVRGSDRGGAVPGVEFTAGGE